MKNDYGADAILHRHGERIYRLAFARCGNHSDAEDLFQEVFLRLVRSNPSFDSEEHCKAWMLRVTTQCARSFWRRAFRKREVPYAVNLEQQADTQELVSDEPLQDAIRHLPETDRMLIHLFYYEGMSGAEIANALAMRPSAVRTRLMRARQKLRCLLEEVDQQHV